MSEPMRRRRFVHPCPPRRSLDEIVDLSLLDAKYVRVGLGTSAQSKQPAGDVGRQEDVTRLVTHADDSELDLAVLAGNDLIPGQRRQLGHS